MSFKVIRGGFLSTIQDYGRLHYKAQGISQSGAADEHGFCWANYLLANDFNAAVLEIALGGVELQAQINTFISLTGADFGFKINQKSAPMWRSVAIKKGDILSCGNPKNGVRGYLAVKNGFDTDTFFASKSVNLREKIGEKLRNNTLLPCTPWVKLSQRITPQKYIPDYQQEIVLRLLPTYQFNDFSQQQRTLFFKQNYTISPSSDRVGCRLEGKPIGDKIRKMISEGISYGSVEITNDGLPIILLKDSPTIGGYAKIGTVFSLDLARLAQKPPASRLRFELMQIADAQTERCQFNQFFKLK